ncbi:MAG: Crp/Fnr family transcriptional regulator [Candidatus Gracilibacteria bacterium]|nr:Crp/Fnr family transcriptional regulator [Candidatus Gracilibacteria bacterium]
MLKKYWYIKQTDLADGLTETDIAMLDGSCMFKEFANKDLIFSPDDPAKRVYVLRQGEVTLYNLSRDGKKVIIDTLKPPTIFGDISFLEEGTQGYYAEASSDSILCVIPKEKFIEIIERRPEITLRLLEISSQRLKRAEELIRDLALSDAKSKIINQLHRLAAKQRAESKDGWFRIDLNLTHEKLANMVGLTRETTTKILNELKEEGFVRMEGKTIFLLDRVGTVLQS